MAPAQNTAASTNHRHPYDGPNELAALPLPDRGSEGGHSGSRGCSVAEAVAVFDADHRCKRSSLLCKGEFACARPGPFWSALAGSMDALDAVNRSVPSLSFGHASHCAIA